MYDEGSEIPTNFTGPNAWWHSHANLITLTAWMAENCYQASEVAHAVEKPWTYDFEWLGARHGVDDIDLQAFRDANPDAELDVLERRIVGALREAEAL